MQDDNDIDQICSDRIGSKLQIYVKITVNILKYPNIKLSGNNTRLFKGETKNNLLFTPCK